MSNFIVRKVAVLGAGVMGAQIAAHCVNARVPVVLFDLPAREGPKDGIVLKAIEGLKKLSPAPLGNKDDAACIEVANYDDHLELLRGCDLVIEAIAERMDWKHDLYKKVAPFIAPHAIFASNTSGLSITALSEGFEADLKARFCGVHFFNPPRYMHLVELIPTAATRPEILDQLEGFLVSTLGKGVVRAKDTPNFIANRVGVFSMLATMFEAQKFGLACDVVDDLTGSKLGRAKSGTFRTADVVGLDTLGHVVKTMQDTLPNDPFAAVYQTPEVLTRLIGAGALGQKAKAGFYKKVGKEVQRLDFATGQYVAGGGKADDLVVRILKEKDPAKRMKALRESTHPQAAFLWAIFRDAFHYIAVHLEAIADNARDVDFAMRWGFGQKLGPFETWQAAGWQSIAEAVKADIAAGATMASAPLPAWVFDGRTGVHGPAGSWSAADQTDKARSTLAVYGRQLYPEQVLGEAPADAGVTLWENEGVRLWHLPAKDARIGILSFKSKMHAIGDEVLDGVLEAVARAERDLDGVVIWHEAPFAVGANLQQVAEACKGGQFDVLERTVAKFQQASMRLKHALVPVVAAVQGMALGGGCEFLMHASHRVLALESYVGLVEAGVGLIPAGGGCKEFALRAAELASRAAGGDVYPFIQNMFNTVAMATVSKSAVQAVELGFAKPSDDIVFNPRELLHVALHRARALAEAGYQPPLVRKDVTVAGRNGIATCEMMLINMQAGGFISEWDYRVARAAATALCGGEVETNAKVSEQWILDVERALFLDLLKSEKTQQRIVHMLETGKPLRN